MGVFDVVNFTRAQVVNFWLAPKVFGFVLRVIAARGLLKGKTIGVDATTLEANAAMRSIVRRDTGDNYQEFLTELAPKF